MYGRSVIETPNADNNRIQELESKDKFHSNIASSVKNPNSIKGTAKSTPINNRFRTIKVTILSFNERSNPVNPLSREE
jgi:hypothetical protein